MIAFLAAAAAFLLATGVFGFGRSGSGLFGGGVDFAYLYQAGVLWLEGRSPYLVSDFVSAYPDASAFAYPPPVLPLSMLLGSFSPNMAELLMHVLNLAAIAAISLGAVQLSLPRDEKQTYRLYVLTALVILSAPFTSHVMWLGQTSLIGVALVVWAFNFYRLRMFVFSGILAALALAKPQLALLPILLLAARFEPRFLVSLVVVSLLVLGWSALAAGGPVQLITEYANSISVYRESPYQAVDFRHVFGLQSVAISLGLHMPAVVAFAILVAGWLYAYVRAPHSDADALAILLSLSLLLFFAHDYDLVALILLVPALYHHLKEQPVLIGICLGALLLLYVPQRLVLTLDLPWLVRYRELVCLGLLCLLIAMNELRLRERQSAAPASL